jgi:hypothetical protein
MRAVRMSLSDVSAPRDDAVNLSKSHSMELMMSTEERKNSVPAFRNPARERLGGQSPEVAET